MVFFFFNKNLPTSIKQQQTPYTKYSSTQEFCQEELYTAWTGATRVSFHGAVGVKITQLVAVQCT